MYTFGYGKELSEDVILRQKTLIDSVMKTILFVIIALFEFYRTAIILFMRGCAGLFALIFVVLVAIIVYRVNISYFNDKLRSKQDTHDE